MHACDQTYLTSNGTWCLFLQLKSIRHRLTSHLCGLQVRKEILQAFHNWSITTRSAYLAIEHEWMHLETLAYMLAQEQRMSFEKAQHAQHGTLSKDQAQRDSTDSNNSSLDCEVPLKTNGDVKSLSTAVTSNGNSNDHSNGHSHSHSNGMSHGHSTVNGHSNGVMTNGDSHSLYSNGHKSGKSASMVQIPAGSVILGTSVDPSKNFVWDNEGPQQIPQHVGTFQMAASPVSNAEFFKFAVECRGYEAEEYWDLDALSCLRKLNQKCPATWTVQVSLISHHNLMLLPVLQPTPTSALLVTFL